MIPNTIHFIFGLDEKFGGKPFSFLHFLAVYSAWKVNRPVDILVHYHYEPDTVWWREARKYVRLNRVKVPTEVFGNPLTHFAHKADVIRLEQLQQHGGIYLDLDVVCLNPFGPLLGHPMVMGCQAGTGLCNAVILADPHSEFLRVWRDSYRTFDQHDWSRHSVLLPFRLAQEHPDWIHVEGPYSFFYPVFNEPVRGDLWARPPLLRHRLIWVGKRLLDYAGQPRSFHTPLRYIGHTLRPGRWHERTLARAYCVHLWEQLWWEPYLKDFTAARILQGASGFARVFRDALGRDELERLAAGGG
ncbi:MAG: hypothetical protein MUC88_08600 [Planctomycetes bacterium]|jgi:hypothetical protein|nr:hypothetical protein [Planctomycetota bacterium]